MDFCFKSLFTVVLSLFVLDVIAFQSMDLHELSLKSKLELSNDNIGIYEDKVGDLSPQEVIECLDEFYRPKQSEVPSNNNRSSVYWVKFQLHHAEHNRSYLMDSHSPNAEKISLYVLKPNGEIELSGETGLQVPLNDRKYRDKNLILDLPTSSNGESWVYLVRIEKGGYCGFNFEITTIDEFLFFSKNEYYFLGLFYGILLVMMVYNLIMFMSFKDTVYVWYLLLIFSAALKTLSEDRLGGLYVWQESPWLSYYMGIHIAPNLVLMAFVGYSFKFLQLTFGNNWQTKLVLSAIGVHWLFYALVSGVWGDLPNSDSLYFLPFAALFYVVIKEFKYGHSVSWYFVAGVAVFLVAILIDEMRHQRWFFGGLWVVFSFHITLVIQSLVLSLSIFDRLRIMKKQGEGLLKQVVDYEKQHIQNMLKISEYAEVVDRLKLKLSITQQPLLDLKEELGKENPLNIELELTLRMFKEIMGDTDAIQSSKTVLEEEKEYFMQKAVLLIHKNMNVTDFGVDQLCGELGVSRAQLYRKFKQFMGKSVKEFIREVRLNEARRLLETTTLSVKEVMYDVGFENRQYFARCYRDMFDQSPSESKAELTI